MAKKNWIRPGVMAEFVLKHVFKRPATHGYPFVKFDMPKDFRAKLNFESEKCIGCMLCMKDCPSRAIVITKVADKSYQCDIDNGRCIYCAQCCLSCAKKALTTTKEYELAAIDRDSMRTKFDAKPAPAPAAPAKS